MDKHVKYCSNPSLWLVLIGLVLCQLSCSAANEKMTRTSAEASQASQVDSVPQDLNPLFWSQLEREYAFKRVGDLMPTANIEKGDAVRELPRGESLSLNLEWNDQSMTLDEFMTVFNNVGVLVLQDGRIRLEAYRNGMNKDKPWISFSVTKSITSTLVGAAITDGYIKSIDDPITRYVPELVGSGYDGVSIRQVLTMTSGVDWSEDYSDPASDVSQFQNVRPKPGEDPTILYMQTLKRAAKPGARWNYNTGETNLIGVLVAKATGKTLSEYLSEKIWKPFGMEHDANWALSVGVSEHCGCCISATLPDFARFGQFVLEEMRKEKSQLLPDNWFGQAGKAQVSTGGGAGYGYQWWTFEEGAFAAIGIFGQFIFIDPSRQLIIATISNWKGAVEGQSIAARQLLRVAVQEAIDEEN